MDFGAAGPLSLLAAIPWLRDLGSPTGKIGMTLPILRGGDAHMAVDCADNRRSRCGCLWRGLQVIDYC